MCVIVCACVCADVIKFTLYGYGFDMNTLRVKIHPHTCTSLYLQITVPILFVFGTQRAHIPPEFPDGRSGPLKVLETLGHYGIKRMAYSHFINPMLSF